jgi:hypothetical protein
MARSLSQQAFTPQDWITGQNDILGLFGTGQRPVDADAIRKDIGGLRTNVIEAQKRNQPALKGGQDPVKYMMDRANAIRSFDPAYADDLTKQALEFKARRDAQMMDQRNKQTNLAQEKELTQQKLAQDLDISKQKISYDQAHDRMNRIYNQYMQMASQMPQIDRNANPSAYNEAYTQFNSLKNLLLNDEYGRTLIGDVATTVAPKQADSTQVVAEIKAAQDENDNGIMDDPSGSYPDLKNRIYQWAAENGLAANSNEVTSLINVLDAQKDQIEAKKAQKKSEKESDIERQKKLLEIESAQYQNDVAQIPAITQRFSVINDKLNGGITVLEMARRNPKGASYVSLKKSLGDAIGGQDFAGLMGKDVQAGLLSKLANLTSSSPVTEPEAKRQIEDAVTAINAEARRFNEEVASKSKGLKSGAKIVKNFKLSLLPPVPGLDYSQSNTREATGEVKTDGKGRKYTVDANGKRVYQ